MAEVDGHPEEPKQPALDADGGFIWPGDEGAKRKSVPGVFVIEKYLMPTTPSGDPITDDVQDATAPTSTTPPTTNSGSSSGGASGDTTGTGGNAGDNGVDTANDGNGDNTPSRSLKRDTKDYSHQVTLTIGGLVMAIGGFILAY